MAESYSHKWGQIIGDLLELTIRERLTSTAENHNLYLDYKKKRQARPGTKVTWKDKYNNNHDLDYVLERGGTEKKLGLPSAFIEIAWRRYTKHSRNKAQEIEGAIVPLSQTYNHLHPFLGIILAGEFTIGSIAQLRSRGFTVAHLTYKQIVDAFKSCGIDASFDEKTPEKEFKNKISKLEALSPDEFLALKWCLIETTKPPLDTFFQQLASSLTRDITRVSVIVLHGEPVNIKSVQEAISYLERYKDLGPCKLAALRYEIDIKYNNGDVIHAVFQLKEESTKFLKSFL